ncbi:helix-turn-helix domain-containing protein [Brachybacterium sp. JHP9]|uniref:Helix-turn-helix domain-containing protein n=1 Tax=Brachybacterium equifaecis TaxID=2910770 RepID=A0ABT0R4F9_9MICO|nr:helix-turn-helix domain-containing protein [Brachybacterium equifaecis]MCL6424368.1 helix-turn-helix domain-containing protein [Brachybacterium equifaecis]
MIRPEAQSTLEVLGHTIEVARIEKQWTQQHLAAVLGVSRATVAAIEKGSGSVAIGTFLSAADALGISLLGTDDIGRDAIRSVLRRELQLMPSRVSRRRKDRRDDDF